MCIRDRGDVVKNGGLAIIGTERHDSRRVDRQLRGRAGRQGDPGSSQFYVSLEDNLTVSYTHLDVYKRQVVENLQAIEDEGEVYESIEEVWSDYPTDDDFLWNEDEY